MLDHIFCTMLRMPAASFVDKFVKVMKHVVEILQKECESAFKKAVEGCTVNQRLGTSDGAKAYMALLKSDPLRPHVEGMEKEEADGRKLASEGEVYLVHKHYMEEEVNPSNLHRKCNLNCNRNLNPNLNPNLHLHLHLHLNPDPDLNHNH